ncbi:MAG: sigma 54-interacting transcriptional regulator [Desulfobacterales bacterium]|nr:sigma 54-interacting transcriptional regulator [Desulfobacterales bacterium]
MTESSIHNLITNRENLERVLDNLKEGIIAHDLNRRIFFFNKEAERVTGFRREDVLGLDCHEAFGHPFCGGQCSFLNTKPIPEDYREYRINITTRSGETRRLEMSVTLMNNEEGRAFGVLASFRDLTDLLNLRLETGKITRFDHIIGQDSQMLQIYKQIQELAEYSFPVHIYGETGTGKELVANAIHNESIRAGAPFVPINCGALPEGLIESELFGHVKGAFSGAIRDKKGRLELADGGTVFLDEVADLPKPMQVKLLRFLQEGTFEKVGGEETKTINVRVISATNRVLKKEVQRHHFREDLYYRLNVIPIHIPPLRERKNDIPLLIDHFLEEAAERHGHPRHRVSKSALVVMLDYPWPGNIRELQNAVQFAIVRCDDGTIRPDNLPLELRQFQAPACRPGPTSKLNPEMVHIALQTAGGNKAKAAKALGVGRATLYRFLDAHPEIQDSLP